MAEVTSGMLRLDLSGFPTSAFRDLLTLCIHFEAEMVLEPCCWDMSRHSSTGWRIWIAVLAKREGVDSVETLSMFCSIPNAEDTMSVMIDGAVFVDEWCNGTCKWHLSIQYRLCYPQAILMTAQGVNRCIQVGGRASKPSWVERTCCQSRFRKKLRQGSANTAFKYTKIESSGLFSKLFSLDCTPWDLAEAQENGCLGITIAKTVNYGAPMVASLWGKILARSRVHHSPLGFVSIALLLVDWYCARSILGPRSRRHIYFLRFWLIDCWKSSFGRGQMPRKHAPQQEWARDPLSLQDLGSRVATLPRSQLLSPGRTEPSWPWFTNSQNLQSNPLSIDATCRFLALRPICLRWRIQGPGVTRQCETQPCQSYHRDRIACCERQHETAIPPECSMLPNASLCKGTPLNRIWESPRLPPWLGCIQGPTWDGAAQSPKLSKD